MTAETIRNEDALTTPETLADYVDQTLNGEEVFGTSEFAHFTITFDGTSVNLSHREPLLWHLSYHPEWVGLMLEGMSRTEWEDRAEEGTSTLGPWEVDHLIDECPDVTDAALSLYQYHVRRLLPHGAHTVTVTNGDESFDGPSLVTDVTLTYGTDGVNMETVWNEVYGVAGTLVNVTDPGTFGSPYLMAVVAEALATGGTY